MTSHPDIDFFSPDDSDDPAYGTVVINGDSVEPSVALEIARQLVEAARFAQGNRHEVPAEQHIVVLGDVISGVEFFGPYDNTEQAITDAERAARIQGGDWHIAQLHAPEKD